MKTEQAADFCRLFFQSLDTTQMHAPFCKVDLSHVGICLPPSSQCRRDTMSRTLKAISMGYGHACVVRTDHALVCWGLNTTGQLGTSAGNFTSQLQAAMPVSGISATMVSAGYDHTCAVLMNSTVSCWGEDGAGQLGNGQRLAGANPVPRLVANLAPVTRFRLELSRRVRDRRAAQFFAGDRTIMANLVTEACHRPRHTAWYRGRSKGLATRFQCRPVPAMHARSLSTTAFNAGERGMEASCSTDP